MNDRTTRADATMIAAFAAVYFFWGTTYLAIRYAIETIPPLLMAGLRFVIAGSLMYLWAARRGAMRPRAGEWKRAAIIGALLFVGGNAGLVWAEQYVPSGLAALILACIPIWMVLLDASRRHGQAPSLRIIGGLVLGMAGLAVLLSPGELFGGGRVNLVGAGVLIAGSLSWAFGSVYSKSVKLHSSSVMVAAMQMLTGGVLLIIVALSIGEGSALILNHVSWLSVASLMYLVVFGSIVGFTAYTWLLAHTTSARVSTYAYVNPIVALIVGWGIGGEGLTIRTLIAGIVIIGGVVLIITHRAPQRVVEQQIGKPEAGMMEANVEG